MTTNLTIKNDKISGYLNTQDSIIGLERAVDNGQTRLALEVLVDIINELFDRVIFLEEKNNLISNPAANVSIENENSTANTSSAKTKETSSLKDNSEKK